MVNMKVFSLIYILPLVVAAAPPTAVLKSGPIFGIQTSLPQAIAPVNKFLGIPYADPPERFGLSKSPKKWIAPRNATAFSRSCLNSGAPLSLIPGGAVFASLQKPLPQREDCLYINVFSPATSGPPSGRPIILYIPGGGFQAGSGIVDLSGFAAYEDVIAMSINYRLNVFGFPNSPDIPLAERNLGLLDQRLALSWVQENAAAFGGDASKVTIWGGSAGSFSVSLHVQSFVNASPPPFRAAIMSSGQSAFGLLATLPDNPENYDIWTTVSKIVNCSEKATNLACMRHVPATMLQEALLAAKAAFVPVKDDITVPAAPATAWKSGKVAKVPLLNTNVAQEGRALVDQSITLTQFTEMFLGPQFVTDSDRDAILAYYKTNAVLTSDFDIIAAIYTDMLWVCPQTLMAGVSASNGQPTWRYHFNTSLTPLLGEQFAWLGAFHGSDVMLVNIAPTFETNQASGMTADLYLMASYLRGMFARFVKNPAGGTAWPGVDSAYTPRDVAVLGNTNTGASGGVSLGDQKDIYDACRLYQSIYQAIESATL